MELRTVDLDSADVPSHAPGSSRRILGTVRGAPRSWSSAWRPRRSSSSNPACATRRPARLSLSVRPHAQEAGGGVRRRARERADEARRRDRRASRNGTRCASRPVRGEATRPGRRASRSSSSARPVLARLGAKTSMASATGGLTSRWVEAQDRFLDLLTATRAKSRLTPTRRNPAFSSTRSEPTLSEAVRAYTGRSASDEKNL